MFCWEIDDSLYRGGERAIVRGFVKDSRHSFYNGRLLTVLLGLFVCLLCLFNLMLGKFGHLASLHRKFSHSFWK